MAFPLPFIPKLHYHPSRGHGRWFGADRNHGRRKHAGCDLIAPEGTDIYAIADGHIEMVNLYFYRGTGYVAVRHTGGFIVRYCEVQPKSIETWTRGTRVSEGQVVARVGKMLKDSMLHFELYQGTKVGDLTNRALKPFQRRADLLNPTALLDRLRGQIVSSAGGTSLPDAAASSVA